MDCKDLSKDCVSCSDDCDYYEIAIKALEMFGRDILYLNGIKIWIGASSTNPLSVRTKDIYRCVLNRLGVEIVECEFDLLLTETVSCDAILMFTFTLGVSARAFELVLTSQLKGNDLKNSLSVFMPSEFEEGYISRALKKRLVAGNIYYQEKKEFEELDTNIFRKCIRDLVTMITDKEREMALNFKPTIVILTALAKEFSKVKYFLSDVTYDDSFGNEKSQYPHGKIGNQSVVLGMTGMGNNAASAITTKILDKYQSIEHAFVIGIAGGIPNFKDPNKHVALGDIVVCNEKGVLQYDMTKTTIDGIESNFSPRPPDPILLRNAQLYCDSINGKSHKFCIYLDDIINKEGIERPDTAVLDESEWTKDKNDIVDPSQRKGSNAEQPYVHFGPIASANTVLKDVEIRNQLRDELKVKAVEMESSGAADALWVARKNYFVIRGICDYANPHKNDAWQEYAAAAAAAFAKSFIEDTLTSDNY